MVSPLGRRTQVIRSTASAADQGARLLADRHCRGAAIVVGGHGLSPDGSGRRLPAEILGQVATDAGTRRPGCGKHGAAAAEDGDK
jgi:hypothetical protein